MYGPEFEGKWSDTLEARPSGMLVPGRRYVVVQAFVDYDGDVHPCGESWRYITSSFLPYDAGLSLFVSLDGVREWHLRLREHPEEQGAIIDRLADYVAPLPEDVPAQAMVPSLGRDRAGFVLRVAGGTMAVALLAGLVGRLGLANGILVTASAGTAALVLALAAWPRRREGALRQRILSPMRTHDVEMLLGSPTQRIEVFPGDVAEVWTYPGGTLLAGQAIGIPLAVEFGGDDRVREVRKLRLNP